MTAEASFLEVLGESGWSLLIQAGVAADESPGDPLRAASRLAKRAPEVPGPRRAAALELVTAGRALAEKLELDERLLATREAVEQATRGRVATWHALRVPPVDRLVEIGCGCGGDSLALSHRVRNLVATDLDPVRAACTHLNLLAVGQGASRAIPGDGLALLEGELDRADAVFVDPARRSEGGRTTDPESWSPPLSALLRLASEGRTVFAKLGPTFDPELVEGVFDVSFVSHRGECVEAFVEPPRAERTRVRAVLLPDDGPAIELEGDRSAAPVADRVDVLHSVDPAAIRAGLLAELCGRHQLGVVRAGIAWLGGSTVIDSPWLTSHEVVVACGLSDVARVLTDHDACDARVHVRGHPARADELHRGWRADLSGSGPTLDVFVTRDDGRDVAFVTRGPTRRGPR